MKKKIGLGLGFLAAILLFQNCAGKFSTEDLDSTTPAQTSSADASTPQSPTSPQAPAPTPGPQPSPLPAPVPPPAPPPVPIETSLGCTLFVTADGKDTNSGKSKSLPLRTLQKAADISTYGDVVCVYPGEYTQFRVRPLSAYAAEDQKIADGILAAEIADTVGVGKYVSTNYPNHPRTRFVSVEKQKAILRLKTGGVDIQRNFVDFVGFEVDGSQMTGTNVLVSSNGSHTRILDNHVHHLVVAQSMIDSGNGGAGIDVAGSGNYIGVEDEIAGNNVHDIWGPPGVKTHLIHGIYMAVPGGYAHDNVVKDIVGFCFHSWHDVQEHRYENNVGSNCAGMVLGSGDNPCETDPRRCHTRDLLIQNNQLTNTDYGILVEGSYYTYDFKLERIVIKNNFRDGVLCKEGLPAKNSEQCPK